MVHGYGESHGRLALEFYVGHIAVSNEVEQLTCEKLSPTSPQIMNHDRRANRGGAGEEGRSTTKQEAPSCPAQVSFAIT